MLAPSPPAPPPQSSPACNNRKDNAWCNAHVQSCRGADWEGMRERCCRTCSLLWPLPNATWPPAEPLDASFQPHADVIDAPRFFFVLAAHLSSLYGAAALILTLFSIRRFHPTAQVLVADNMSPGMKLTQGRSPVSNQQFSEWYRQRVRVISTEVEGARDMASFAAALQHIRMLSTEELGRFDQFVFMQLSTILTEPVPPLTAGPRGGHCHVRPFLPFGQNLVQEEILGTKNHSYLTHLRGVGLLGRAGPHPEWDVWKPAQAAHCAFAADSIGLRALIAPKGELLPAGVPSVFDSPSTGADWTNWTSNMSAAASTKLRREAKQFMLERREALAGAIITARPSHYFTMALFYYGISLL